MLSPDRFLTEQTYPTLLRTPGRYGFPGERADGIHSALIDQTTPGTESRPRNKPLARTNAQDSDLKISKYKKLRDLSMGVIIASVAGLIFLFWLGLTGAITLLVTGGIGYALGSIASNGWAIFGTILGLLIGFAAISKR